MTKESAQAYWMRVAGLLLLVVVCSVLGSSALAQPGDQPIAKPIVDDAVAQYNLGHFAEASALFEKAYRIDPAPVLLFNIGQCHRRLGNNDLALFFYRQYLDQAPPNAPERPDVVKRVADLERSLRDQAALKDKPPPGVARAVPADGTSENLPPPTPGPAATGGAPILDTGPNQPGGDLPMEQADRSRRALRIATWTTGGLAVGALALGIVEAVVWSNRADRFNNHTGPTMADPTGASRNCGADDPNHGGMGCASLYDDVSKARTWAIVGLAGGGALAAASLILFLKSGPLQDGGPSAAVSCGPTFYASGVTCRLSF